MSDTPEPEVIPDDATDPVAHPELAGLYPPQERLEIAPHLKVLRQNIPVADKGTRAHVDPGEGKDWGYYVFDDGWVREPGQPDTPPA